MRTLVAVLLGLALAGCGRGRLERLLATYREQKGIRDDDSDRYELHKLEHVRDIKVGDREYEVVYWEFSWSTSNTGAGHQTQKLLFFDADGACKGLVSVDEPLSLKDCGGTASRLDLVTTDGHSAMVDVSGGLPPSVSGPVFFHEP
jgi:hypothetical protein